MAEWDQRVVPSHLKRHSARAAGRPCMSVRESNYDARVLARNFVVWKVTLVK